MRGAHRDVARFGHRRDHALRRRQHRPSKAFGHWLKYDADAAERSVQEMHDFLAATCFISVNQFSRQTLPGKIHRRDVAILGTWLGRRKWREGTGAAQDFERLTIEHIVA
jgi:hypothetical protein